MKKHRDMTAGNVVQQLITFAVPIFLGELLQQLYTTADTVILGNFVGPYAMAAVGGTSSVTKVLVGFFNGISVGCTVIVARAFGAKDEKALRRSVHTIVWLSLLLGVLFSAIGVMITTPVLRILSTPENVMPLAKQYIQIYFSGLTGLVLYNTLTGILRAVGDSRRPLVFLTFSAVLNVALNLVFVLEFGMGVDGVGYATILSQGISAVLCLLLLMRTKEAYGFSFAERGFSFDIIGQVVRLGVPIGVQKSLNSFSNVLVLSFINFFSDYCLAGWTIYSKINHLVSISMQSLGSATTTFVSQNLGAKQKQRAHLGVKTAMTATTIAVIIMSFAVYIFRAPMARLFGDDAETLRYAELFISNLIFYQLIHGFHIIYGAALRGSGYASIATIISLVGQIGIKQLYLLVVVKGFGWNTPVSVGMAFPVGWLAAGTGMTLCYSWAQKRARKRQDNK